MADEELVTFSEDNDVDMDYLEMDSPEPEPFEFYSDQTRDSESNLVGLMRDPDDVKTTSEFEEAHPAQIHRHRSSYTMQNETRVLMNQFRATIGELERDLAESRSSCEKALVEKETLIISYDSRIDELNLEIDEMQIESQQYQLRYSEINEELHDLRSRAAENVSSGKENEELVMRLQNKEQNVMDLMIDFESANKQVERLKNQIRDSNENTAKLQKMLIIIKKDKTVLEKNLQSVIDKYDILSKQYRLEVSSLSDRMAQLQRENEIYRQSLSNAEQERQEMQTNFTEATMELLADEMNEAHGDEMHLDESEPMRLARISSGDFTHHHTHNHSEMDSPIHSAASFVKQRYGSQTSLPDESLLQTLAAQDSHDDWHHHHSRKSSNISVDSRGVGVAAIHDTAMLKQDIREVVSEVMVSDIKTIIRQEMMMKNNDSANDPELANKIDELVAITQDRRKRSVDLAQINESEQGRLNQMIVSFEKEVISNMASSAKDRAAFEDAMNDKLRVLSDNIGATDDVNDSVKKTIEDQMTVFQIALENEIADQMQNVVKDLAAAAPDTSNLRQNIKMDLTQCFDEIRSLLSRPPTTTDANDKIDATLSSVMNGKIDAFMDEFRKEVIPEVEAVFAQLSNMKSYDASAADGDDEKANYDENHHNELMVENERLQEEIAQLSKKQNEHERVLRSAATSKVHQVVKLQNLLDHMRNDNRILQFKLEKYQNKFAQIKQNEYDAAAQNKLNVVNKVWQYFGAANSNNPTSHLST